MRERRIQTASANSRVVVGAIGSFDVSLCDGCRPLMVVDDGFYQAHPTYMSGFDIIRLPSGENSKSLATVEKLYREFRSRQLERSSFVVACGGGVISDITGFAAATYLRGVRYGVVATTLLSQVDASIGGKNGINYGGIKNLIGTIRQPEFCLCDTALLSTLSGRERAEGFAEVIKHAAIADSELFSYLEQHSSRALQLDAESISHIVWRSINIKADIVERDELEGGERRKLNFGHTIGHAIESSLALPHGSAVAIGMILEAKLAERRAMISVSDVERISNLVKAYGLPQSALFEPGRVSEAMRYDKKRCNDAIMLPLLERIGSVRIEPIRLDECEQVL